MSESVRTEKSYPNPYLPGTEHWVTEDNIFDIASAVEGWRVFKAHGKDVLWPNESDEWLGIGYGIGCKIQIPSE